MSHGDIFAQPGRLFISLAGREVEEWNEETGCHFMITAWKVPLNRTVMNYILYLKLQKMTLPVLCVLF